jgi:hypothetical protein
MQPTRFQCGCYIYPANTACITYTGINTLSRKIITYAGQVLSTIYLYSFALEWLPAIYEVKLDIQMVIRVTHTLTRTNYHKLSLFGTHI